MCINLVAKNSNTEYDDNGNINIDVYYGRIKAS